MKPAAWWIPKAEQFCLAKQDGARPFAKAWEPLYAFDADMQSQAADAARYRWLRDCKHPTWRSFQAQWQMSAEQCDAAIDAARTA